MPERDRPEISTRPFWSGTITFGLVNIPVSLLPANRSDRTSLRMVSPKGQPLSRRYFSAANNRPLESNDIVRGYEVEKDSFVIVEEDELERLAPEKTRDIDLRVFKKAEDIDPKHFERAYFLVPAGGSNKAYRLLARVMEDTGRAGVATFVMRGKEYLVAIFAENGILRAETLRFADELRTPETIGLPELPDPDTEEVRRIVSAIGKLEEKKLDTRELDEESARRLEKIVSRKLRSGKDVVHYEAEEETSVEVIDLMERLQRSLRGTDDGSDGRRSGAPGRRPEAKAKGKTPNPSLEDRSKADLYEQAQALDIAGRSSMTKAELIDAISEAAPTATSR